jgi:hypothetical protein
MLPTTAAGHRGAIASPGSSGAGGMPSPAIATRAQRLVVANSRLRDSTARATTARSSGNGSGSAESSNASAATTPACRISSITAFSSVMRTLLRTD